MMIPDSVYSVGLETVFLCLHINSYYYSEKLLYKIIIKYYVFVNYPPYIYLHFRRFRRPCMWCVYICVHISYFMNVITPMSSLIFRILKLTYKKVQILLLTTIKIIIARC